MAFNLIQLQELCKKKSDLLEQLRLWKLIPREGEYKCHKCGGYMKLYSDDSRTDGFRWHCNNSVKKYAKSKRKKCGVFVEFRNNSFFAGSQLSIFQILGFVHLWVDNTSLSIISSQLGISIDMAHYWFVFCSNVLLDAFILNSVKLGGPGKVVEIDKSKYLCTIKRSVFGAYERGSGRVFMVDTEDGERDTLLPVIKDWIEEGTTVVSDYLRKYDCRSSEGYEYLKMNYKLCFNDPVTDSHTNVIEASQTAAMSSSGRQMVQTPFILACCIFNKRCEDMELNGIDEFLKLAGQLYNPLMPRRNKYMAVSDREFLEKLQTR